MYIFLPTSYVLVYKVSFSSKKNLMMESQNVLQKNSILINFNFITREVLSNPAWLPNLVLEPESESLVSGLRPPVPGQCLRPHRSPRSQASNLRCVRLSGAGAGGSLSVKYHRHFHTITVPLRSKESYQRHLYKCL